MSYTLFCLIFKVNYLGIRHCEKHCSFLVQSVNVRSPLWIGRFANVNKQTNGLIIFTTNIHKNDHINNNKKGKTVDITSFSQKTEGIQAWKDLEKWQ